MEFSHFSKAWVPWQCSKIYMSSLFICGVTAWSNWLNICNISSISELLCPFQPLVSGYATSGVTRICVFTEAET